MSETQPVIVWFRQDLRLTDNPAVSAALKMNAPVLPLFVLDDDNAGEFRRGAASRWWLHQSLKALDQDLDGALLCLAGDTATVLPKLVRNVNAAAVFWNRCYEPWRIDRDKRIKSELSGSNVKVRSFNGSLLFEPPNISKEDGDPYKVFTPFYRNGCLENGPPPRKPANRSVPKDYFRDHGEEGIDDLELIPSIKWYDGIEEEWMPGEQGAKARLEEFLETGLEDYAEGRDRPDKRSVSRLSPHLHFGELSPNSAWYAVKEFENRKGFEKSVDKFLSELGWREFCHYLLYYWPTLPTDSMQKKFDRFSWRDDDEGLRRWQKGQTGCPIVDAGMRELWRTGYMHNRVRMLAASFLVKNLMIHWREGEQWFWDTLVDADLANNSAGWQWVAGSGADAAPFFRIFNPVTQSRKFDPDGDYVRRYVPELKDLPTKYLHEPWEAPQEVLQEAGVELGETYPELIVDLKASRERALEAFQSLSGK